MSKTLAADLRAARALIDTPEKWVKYRWGVSGHYCAAGALREALGFEILPKGMVDSSFWSHPAVKEVVGQTPYGIVAFNDDPATQHSDVLAVFDRAIAAAETSP